MIIPSSRPHAVAVPRAMLLFAACYLALPAVPARAQVVFDNGGPNNATGFYSDPVRDQLLADTFTFGSATTFNTVEWFGGYFENDTFPGPDNFTISLHTTTGGVPDAVGFATFLVGDAATKTDTGGTFADFNGERVFRYSFSLAAPLALAPGTYGISIVNTTNDPENAWLWAKVSDTAGSLYVRPTTADVFLRDQGELAFRLVNNAAVVPEPGTLALLAAGGALPLTGIARRRRRRAA